MYGDLEDIAVRLPCNHQSVVSIGILKTISTEDCLAAHCELETCGKRIMDKRDEGLLELAARKQERAQWAIEQIDWERLDHEIRDRSSTVNISGHDLYLSIKTALASMRAPKSATSAALDPTAFVETTLVKKHFKQILSGAQTIDWTARKVLIKLQQDASRALKAASPFAREVLLIMLPPGFEEFLVKWLTRAVNHAMPSSINMSEEDVEANFVGVMNSMENVGLDQIVQEEADDGDEHDDMEM